MIQIMLIYLYNIIYIYLYLDDLGSIYPVKWISNECHTVSNISHFTAQYDKFIRGWGCNFFECMPPSSRKKHVQALTSTAMDAMDISIAKRVMFRPCPEGMANSGPNMAIVETFFPTSFFLSNTKISSIYNSVLPQNSCSDLVQTDSKKTFRNVKPMRNLTETNPNPCKIHTLSIRNPTKSIQNPSETQQNDGDFRYLEVLTNNKRTLLGSTN